MIPIKYQLYYKIITVIIEIGNHKKYLMVITVIIGIGNHKKYLMVNSKKK